MQYFDIKILKKNIQNQMAKRGTTQKALADYLNMSQPNVSKALNLNDKKCFTLEQTYLISSFFNVPVDYLVGKRKADSIVSNQEIAQMLVALIETDKVSFSEINMTEVEHAPESPAEPEGTTVNREMTYHSLYFRNYWTPIPFYDDISGDQLLTLMSKGNYTGNYDINNFLEKYIPAYKLYKNDGMDDAQYRDIVQGLLSKIE